MDKKTILILMLATMCTVFYALALFLLVNYVATWSNSAFWGAILGAVISGAVTITVFRITAKNSRKQFVTAMMKDRSRLIIKGIKETNYSQNPGFIYLDISEGSETVAVGEFMLEVENNGKSIAEDTLLKLKGFTYPTDKLLGKCEYDFEYIDAGSIQEKRLHIKYNPNIDFAIDVSVYYKYLDIDMQKKNKVLMMLDGIWENLF